MPRAFWKGAINFGMVVIPVKMYTATKSERPNFHLLHKKDLNRIKQVLYCPGDDKYLERKDTVKGFEYTKGKYIVLKDSDFEKIPVKTKHTIDVVGFVESGEIDPIYFYDAHYLEPEEIGSRPYALFREVLADTKRIGIAKAVFQRQEHLCCIRPNGKILILHTLHYQHEIRDADKLNIKESEINQKEKKMAESLINEMIIEFKPEQYRDEYRVALERMIKEKLEGKEISVSEKHEEEAIPDLMEALRRSLESRQNQEKKEKVGAGAER